MSAILSRNAATWVAASRLAQLGSTAILLLVVASTLTATEQGGYFLILSIVAAQSIFELGLNQVFVAELAYRRGAVRDVSPLAIGETKAAANSDSTALFILGRQIKKRYLSAAAKYLIVLYLVSSAYAVFIDSETATLWYLSSIIAITGNAIILQNGARLTILEGFELIHYAAIVRISQFLVYSIVAVSLLDAFRLYAVGLAYLSAAVISSGLAVYFIRKRKLFTHPNDGPTFILTDSKADHAKNLLNSFQRKMAGTALAGYFVNNAATPIIYATLGATTAGRYGLTAAVAAGLLAVSYSILFSQFPAFARNIGAEKYEIARRIFFKYVKFSFFFLFCGLLFFNIFIIFPLSFTKEVVQKLLSPADTLLLSISTLISAVSIFSATYVRASREEPFFFPTLIGGCLSLLIWGLVGPLGLTLALVGQVVIGLGIGVPWTLKISKPFFKHDR